jgi:hypothetical protein
MFLPQCERPSFSPTHNNKQNYCSVLTILRDSKVYCGNSHRNESMYQAVYTKQTSPLSIMTVSYIQLNDNPSERL